MNLLGIFTPRRFGRLFVSDAMNVSRDPTLIFATLLSIVPSVAFHFGKAPMDAAAFSTFGVDVFSRYVAPVAISMPAFLIGWVTGFLFLEDRDDGPLLALDVTPAGKRGFMAYRIAVTAALAIAVTLFGAPLVLPTAGWPMILLLALLVASEAISAAFILPALARNKVEGLAITKLTNLASIAALLAIIPSPLRYLAGIIPTFWIGEMLEISEQQYLPSSVLVALALVVHIGVAAMLYRLAQRRAG